MSSGNQIKVSLFFLRVSVFIVMFVWSLDKFLNPGHAAKVFEYFYHIDNLSESASYLIGSAQIAIVIGFLLGVKKKLTYGAVLIMHFISTLSSYKIYLSPWDIPNILFWAAFPMLAACYTLWALREQDTLFVLGDD